MVFLFFFYNIFYIFLSILMKIFKELVNLTETNENFSPLISTTFANGMDYLMEVGNQIQQALINFGN